jgi:hypothetical protein
MKNFKILIRYKTFWIHNTASNLHNLCPNRSKNARDVRWQRLLKVISSVVVTSLVIPSFEDKSWNKSTSDLNMAKAVKDSAKKLPVPVPYF